MASLFDGVTALLKNNAQGHSKVAPTDLKGKTVAIYFSASWCPPCQRFTPELAKVYAQCAAESKPLEVVFVSLDQDENQFNGYFKKMPWLALPLGSAACSTLTQKYGVMTIPKLVVLNERGETITADGCDAITKLGAAGFPWTNFRSSVCSKCVVS